MDQFLGRIEVAFLEQLLEQPESSTLFSSIVDVMVEDLLGAAAGEWPGRSRQMARAGIEPATPRFSVASEECRVVHSGALWLGSGDSRCLVVCSGAPGGFQTVSKTARGEREQARRRVWPTWSPALRTTSPSHRRRATVSPHACACTSSTFASRLNEVASDAFTLSAEVRQSGGAPAHFGGTVAA